MVKKIRLNLGCASRPLKNYINVDQDNLKTIKNRYPNLKKIKNLKIYNFNIFKLPFKDSTVDEIKDTSSQEDSKLADDDTKDEDVDESIESVPFISEPVKKKRTRSSK